MHTINITVTLLTSQYAQLSKCQQWQPLTK